MKQAARLRRARDSADLWTRTVASLETCTTCRHPDPHSVIDHIVDALNGWPGAQSYEQDRSTGHSLVRDEDTGLRPTIADPTGEAAILPDRAARDLREIDKRIRRIATDVETVIALLAVYVPRTANPKARRETARFNDPGCGSCARLPSPADPKISRYEPPHTRTVWLVNGRAMLLCLWCRRWVRSTGRLPTTLELAAHHRGVTVRKPAEDSGIRVPL